MPPPSTVFSTTYPKVAFVPISFVLGLIALTFPCVPTRQDVAQFNLFFDTLLEILPIQGVQFRSFRRFEHLNSTTVSRRNIVELVMSLHTFVLDEVIDVTTYLRFFNVLRATECKRPEPSSPSASSGEQGCVRTGPLSVPNTCCIASFSRHRENDVFWIDPSLGFYPPSLSELETEWTTENAFCSCYFSAKWFLLHLIASAFPQQPTAHDRFLYHTFLTLFGKLLACFACRVNFTSNLELAHYQPLKSLISNASFVTFIETLHTTVNTMLHKQVNSQQQQSTRDFLHRLSQLDQETYQGQIIIVSQKNMFGRYFIEPN